MYNNKGTDYWPDLSYLSIGEFETNKEIKLAITIKHQ